MTAFRCLLGLALLISASASGAADSAGGGVSQELPKVLLENLASEGDAVFTKLAP
jgi:hypothetical protein